MLNTREKIKYLENQLNIIPNNYADTFKIDIYMFIEDFNEENILLKFLNKLSSKKSIDDWVNKLTSRIVMKFDEEFESINDFIFDYIELG